MRPPRDLPPPVRGFTIVTENGLYRCDACGWWVIPVDVAGHGKDSFRPCNKKGGDAVKRLIENLPELNPQQNGYGDSRLAFQLSGVTARGVVDHTTGIKFSVDERGRFRVEGFHHHVPVSAEKVEELVRFLATWSQLR